ncbi:MAG TPA: 50S ribosomal protein L4 [Tenacibaculum sp.]|nr:50S ribosomal protein L4 [Tenacibaculum sp.]
MNKKERRKALFCVLSSKLKNKDLVIIDDIKLKEIKTKQMVEIFSKLPV